MQLKCERVSYEYVGGTDRLFAEVSATWQSGSLNALRGPSGSGKSTLLDLLGGIRTPVAGNVHLIEDDGRVLPIDEHQRSIAWVLQSNILFSRRTVLDNVMMGAVAHGQRAADLHGQSLAVLESVGLETRAARIVNTLSGGERQRVTIARSLIAPSSVILADEPTGNLDSVNTSRIVDCLELAASRGKIVVVATHDPVVVERCDSLIDLSAQA